MPARELEIRTSAARPAQILHRVPNGYIRNHLIEYCGKDQIARMNEKRKVYPLWRKRTGKGARGEPVHDGTIRHELITSRAILRCAANKHLIPEAAWYRTVVYNFIPIMANTGLRTIAGRNPRWRAMPRPR